MKNSKKYGIIAIFLVIGALLQFWAENPKMGVMYLCLGLVGGIAAGIFKMKEKQ